MGCNTSRLDHLPAVVLCRDRCKFLEEAVHHCHAIADANFAYLVSLQTLASSLHPSLEQHNDIDLDHSHSDDRHSGSDSKVVHPPEEEQPVSESYLLHPVYTNKCSFNHATNIGYSPPPAPSSSAWDFLNFFETYDQGYELPIEEKGDLPTDEPQPAFPNHQKTVTTNINARLEEVPESVSVNEQLKEGVEVATKSMESLFARAASSGNEVLRILDSRKLLSKEFISSNVRKGIGSFTEDRSLSMSSALRKLLIWEKKLCNEVKAEEKLRTVYVKKYTQIKSSVNNKRGKGREFNAHQNLLGVLFTNIRVAIQVLERTSAMINNLRDEELWPLIADLMHKLVGMWKDLGEYHRSQYEAFVDPRIRFSFLSETNSEVEHSDLEALVQLNIELQNTNTSFHNLITAQRGLFKALNGWLMNPLDSEQEPEGKPGGLPKVFILCRKWSLVMDLVSESEVSEAMQGLSSSIDKLLEKCYTCLLKQKPSQGQDGDRRITLLEKELLRTKKQAEVQWKKRRLFLPANKDIICRLPLEEEIDQMGKSTNSCLVMGVRRIFMALERFSADMSEAYGEIHVDAEEINTPLYA